VVCWIHELIVKLVVYALCILATQAAYAEILLDKLTACNDIERVYITLKSRPAILPSECRAPRAGLESALVHERTQLHRGFVSSAHSQRRSWTVFRVSDSTEASTTDAEDLNMFSHGIDG
jgi:hypothetical protein